MFNRRRFMQSLFGAGVTLPAAVQVKASQEKNLLLQNSPIAGFQYYDGEDIWPRLKVGDALTLKREPANRYDKRAVEVFWQRRKLGYVPRLDNCAVAQILDRGLILHARISGLRDDLNPWSRVRIEIRASVRP